MSSFIIIILLLFVSCSQKSKTETNLVISLNSLTQGTIYAGGGLLKLENPLTKEVLEFELDQDYLVSIPRGAWNFYFVGFKGPDKWTGDSECGQTKDVLLDTNEAEVIISSTATSCSDELFVDMKIKVGIAIVGSWNVGKFGETVWAP